MKTAIITAIDDKVLDNFEKDFLPTLRGAGQYKGPVFVIYYGKNDNLIRQLANKFYVKFIKLEKGGKAKVFNRRYIDLAKVLSILPKEISNIMIIDGGDVWFQKPFFEIFEKTSQGYGYVEEEFWADGEFNVGVVSKIKDVKLAKLLLGAVKGFKLINGGMLVGEKRKIELVTKEVANILKKSGDDFFGLDQAILNYIIRRDADGIKLDTQYNFALVSRQNDFSMKDKLLYDFNKELVSVVHNCGGEYGRVYKNGRRDLPSIPTIPQKCTGSFWGITTFFNPAGFKNKIENYRIFRESSKRQGLKLLTIECAFGNKPFELTKDDAEIILQVRTTSTLWQKERLLNIALDNLPEDCDKFAWLDADVIFLNDNWIKETSELLNSYPVIQPFSTYIRMRRGIKRMSEQEVRKLPFSESVDIEGYRFFGVAYKISQLGRKMMLNSPMRRYGHPGMAWSARRDIFRQYGLFDRSLLSAVDMVMAHMFYNNELGKDCDYYVAGPLKKYIYEWSNKVHSNINGSVYYTDGILLHLWHGDMKNRRNEECKAILNKFNFSPEEDIKKDSNGCWVWTSKKPELQKEFQKYFLTRNESGSMRVNVILFLVNFFKTEKNFLEKTYFNIYLKIDRVIGLIGLLVKKISPPAYVKLRKIKDYFMNVVK